MIYCCSRGNKSVWNYICFVKCSYRPYLYVVDQRLTPIQKTKYKGTQKKHIFVFHTQQHHCSATMVSIPGTVHYHNHYYFNQEEKEAYWLLGKCEEMSSSGSCLVNAELYAAFCLDVMKHNIVCKWNRNRVAVMSKPILASLSLIGFENEMYFLMMTIQIYQRWHWVNTPLH